MGAEPLGLQRAAERDGGPFGHFGGCEAEETLAHDLIGAGTAARAEEPTMSAAQEYGREGIMWRGPAGRRRSEGHAGGGAGR